MPGVRDAGRRKTWTRDTTFAPSLREEPGVGRLARLLKATCAARVSHGGPHELRCLLLQRYEDAMPDLSRHGLANVPLTRRVLSEKHLTRAEHTRGAVAGHDFDGCVEVDYKLPARRGVKVKVVVGRGLPEDHTPGRNQFGDTAMRARLKVNFDLSKM